MAQDPKPWDRQPVEPIAEVASATGVVEAIDWEGQSRWLATGDEITPGDRVQVASGSSAGLWIGDVLVQIEEGSRIRLLPTAEGGARITLEIGGVRVVDPRDSGPPIELTALDSRTAMLGGDREARVLIEKTGQYALICDWARPFAVARGEQLASAPVGDCVVGHNREPLFKAPGHADRIALLAGAPSVATAGPGTNVANLLTPPALLPPVSAGFVGGSGPGSLGANPGDGAILAVPGLPIAVQSPCGTIRGNCGPGGRGGTVIIETPPTMDPFPGAGGTGSTGPLVETPPTGDTFPGANN